MTLIVKYDDDGTVTDWYYPVDNADPGDGEIAIDPREYDHRAINRGEYVVEDGNLVDNESYDPREPHEHLRDKLHTLAGDQDGTLGGLIAEEQADLEERIEKARNELAELLNDHPVRRQHLSESTRTEWRNAREDGDLQKQLDLAFEVLTGEEIDND